MKKGLKILIILIVIVVGYIAIDSTFRTSKQGKPDAWCFYKWQPVKIYNAGAHDGGIEVYNLSGKYIDTVENTIPLVFGGNSIGISESSLHLCLGKYK
jgi:hypothetical protein